MGIKLSYDDIKARPKYINTDITFDKSKDSWTTDLVLIANNKITTEELCPIVIISYKRGGKASTIQMLKNTAVKTFLFVYDDDYKNYKEEVETANNIEVILCPSAEFRGAAKKRDYVQSTMRARGYKDYFILDDDISALYSTEPGATNSGAYKAQKIKLSPEQFFKTWYYVIHNIVDERISLGGIISEASAWAQNLNTIPVSNNTGRICQIMYINAEDFEAHNIKYNNTKAWDDFDVQLQVYKEGLNVSQIRWLTYEGDVMNPSNSVASAGDFTWTKKSMNLYKTWGEYVGFKPDKNQLNSTFAWGRIKKDVKETGTLTPTFKEEWKKYFEADEVDYIGFTELWKDKIREWDLKHYKKDKLIELGILPAEEIIEEESVKNESSDNTENV